MVDRFTNIGKTVRYDADKKSFLLWAQDEGKPVHGGYLTAIGQQQSYDRSRVVRSMMPSGFLACGRRTIIGRAEDALPGDLVCGAIAADSATFYLYAPDEEYVVNVGGHLVTLYHILGNSAGAASPPSADYLAIKLPAAPTATDSNRFDLVFLEVWRQEVNSSDTIYYHGSVDSGEAALVNDLTDSRESRGQVNAALQLRSRIRVVSGIDYATHPRGMSDVTNVKGRGYKAANTTYTFTVQDDPGLWRHDANAAGILAGTVFYDASEGTIDGGFITGITPSTRIGVIRSITPSSTQTLTAFYNWSPSLIPPLPATLAVEMLAMEDVLWTSNLGTGGGTIGQPWTNPLLHIPESVSITSDRSLTNVKGLDITSFKISVGLLRMPIRGETPWELITSLTSPTTDGEGRPFYAQANQEVAAFAEPLLTIQWHRTARFGIARVLTTAGQFYKGDLVLVGLTETASSRQNRVGIRTSDSTFAAFAIPLRAL